MVQPALSMNLVLQSWRNSLHSFMSAGGLKCWWPFQCDNVALNFCACCRTSDLPVTMGKVIATSHCISHLCFTISACCLCNSCMRACSQWLNDDKIHVVHPAQSWESTWGRHHSVRHKHLLWVSTTGLIWIQDSWLDGLWVSSCLVVLVRLLHRKLKCFARGSDCSQAFKVSALAFVDWTHRVLKKQQDTRWQI